MAKIRSNTPLDIVINGSTSLTVDSTGISISGSITANSITTTTSSIDTGSFVTTSSFNSFTGSYQTDSSSFNNRIDSLTNATSSYVLNSATSSFVTNSQTSSFITNSQTSSMTVLSSSYATTASYAMNGGGSGTFASRFIIHNGEGSTTALTTGIKYTTTVISDKSSTITGWKIFCNPSSSITLDVLKANKTKPTAANSITGSAAPTITNNQYAESTTLTGWTTSVAAGDILVLNIVSNTAASYIQLELTQQ